MNDYGTLFLIKIKKVFFFPHNYRSQAPSIMVWDDLDELCSALVEEDPHSSQQSSNSLISEFIADTIYMHQSIFRTNMENNVKERWFQPPLVTMIATGDKQELQELRLI